MALSGELKGKGVDVTNIYPFWVKTNLLKSPEYGSAKINKLPSFFAGNPAKVIQEAIEGIRKRKLHVYPGMYAKIVFSASRWSPIVSKQAH
jgi:short-subunit dehydrogenase